MYDMLTGSYYLKICNMISWKRKFKGCVACPPQ